MQQEFLEDGRERFVPSVDPAAFKTEGHLCNAWPPGGGEPKFPRLGGGPLRELVQGFSARAGELVQIAPEFRTGCACARFAGKVGRVTQSYGDGYVGVLFQGEQREEVLMAGENGIFQASYAHGSGTKEAHLDVEPPRVNAFGKLKTSAPSPPTSEASSRYGSPAGSPKTQSVRAPQSRHAPASSPPLPH
ncbi:hypothetical protein T484DRAFT_1918551 [Baffinella frigidus]|nr:hypothetical protein T484DRAFT_1918551 [Cryptophyta sp. CCMP2293]|mmetsp:Transcript_53408/g.127067  ORF Transcript_53408/g.127067 Transcript_53408/m.127067 type:complete len:190 (-) Transcript_53408:97-666(-)